MAPPSCTEVLEACDGALNLCAGVIDEQDNVINALQEHNTSLQKQLHKADNNKTITIPELLGWTAAGILAGFALGITINIAL